MCLPFTYYINDLSLARRAFAHELPSMTKRRKVVPARLPLQVQSGARYRHTWAFLEYCYYVGCEVAVRRVEGSTDELQHL